MTPYEFDELMGANAYRSEEGKRFYAGTAENLDAVFALTEEDFADRAGLDELDEDCDDDPDYPGGAE